MTKKLTINPITRLEGHGKIEIFLDDKGGVKDAYFQVVELRGFERFCLGRPAEEMPRIVPNICGVCPSPHNIASTKALDDLYSVEPTTTAKLDKAASLQCVLCGRSLHTLLLPGRTGFRTWSRC